MKTEYLLKAMVLWIVICLPAWAGAEDMGFLHLSQMEGDVQFQSKGTTEWLPATINLPVQSGDHLWVPQEAWAQVETRDGSVIRLDAESSLEILAVDETSQQMYLSQGQAYVNFKRVDDSMLQLDTPVSSIRIYDSSTFNVDLAENGNTEISVFRGAVYAENRSGEVRVAAGKMLSMDDDLPSLMALAPPSDWERWNKEWDDLMAEGEESGQYLPPELSGYEPDLDRNGRWVESREYGYVWTPTVDISADWAPYRDGRWVWMGDDYVWVASEPWGWAPYHYGRWSYISSYGWCWVPPRRNEVYWGPGYVSWVSTSNDVAWVPLAPGETYYGHGHYGPHSVNIANADIHVVIPGRNYRNAHVRNAVSVVRRDAFLRGRYRDRDMRHRENPFLKERINIGQPRIKPERATRMPIIRDIPKRHRPPEHIRSISGRTGDENRQMVRDRDRSVFRPSLAPRTFLPSTLMRSNSTLKKAKERHAPEAGKRQQMPGNNVVPRQSGERPTINREDVRRAKRPASGKIESGVPVIPPDQGNIPGQLRGRRSLSPEQMRSGKSPAQVQPQMAPSSGQSTRIKPVPAADEKAAPQFHGRSQRPDQGNIREQLRARPAINPEKIRSEKPPVQVRPQVAPSPAKPLRIKPVPEVRPEKPAIFRGRPQMPAKENMPGQRRGTPAINPEKIRSGNPPVQVQSPPVPAPAVNKAAKTDAEELKRLQQEEAAKKQDERKKILENFQQRRMRPKFP